MIVAIGTVACESERDTRSIGQQGTFRPFLPRSVGFGPVFGPPSGALLIAPSAERKDQSMPICSS